MPAPVPTPFPMPFVGQVEFSAVGLLMGIGIGAAMSFVTGSPPTGPVVVNGFHAVKTGDEAKNAETLPHIVIPPGTMWTPLPKPLKLKISPPPPAPDNPAAPAGDAIFITGSKTVTFEQSTACRLGTLAMSCSDPVRLPSSVLLAVPKGLPVLVGGPPAIDWMAAAKAFFLRNKWTAGLLHQLVSLLPPGRLQNLLGKGVCFLTGHPVDVATGRLLTWSEDFVLRGPLPLAFERNYSSGWAERPSTLGHGWSHTYDERIWVERGRVVYLAGDGREIEFHTHELSGRVMREGQELFYPIDRLTLRCLGKGKWSIRSADGLVREFEIAAEGDRTTSQIARIVDRHGHSIRFLYRGGYLERVETSEGRAIRFEHRDGRLARISVPAGQVDGWYDQVRFGYSTDGDLIASHDSANRPKTYVYDDHLLVRERDRDGVTFWFEYDGRDSTARCVRTWGSDGKTTDRLMYRDITYDIAGRRTFVEDSLGNTTIYAMNPANAVVEVTDPHGGARKLAYDEHLWKTAETDALGQVTRVAYDTRGNETLREWPDGSRATASYDADDQPLAMTDALGVKWQWEYDPRKRLLCRRNDAGEITRLEYDGRALRRVTRTDERSFIYEYDEAENIRRTTCPDGTLQESWHDRNGRLTKVRDALGRVRRMTYDNEGRVALLQEPGGIWRQLTYSGEGDIIEYRDNLRQAHFGYSGFHRVARRVEGGEQVSYHYDSEADLSKVVNELNEEHSFTRDACGRVVEEDGFDGRHYAFTRDLAGRVCTTVHPGGAQDKLAYDKRGRVVALSHADGTADEYEYDPSGNLLMARNDTGTVTWIRDARGRPLREDFEGEWVESAYDTLGRRVEVRSSRGLRQHLTLAPMGTTLRVAVWGASDGGVEEPRWRADFERDALGRETRRSLPGGSSSSREYDERGLPQLQSLSSAQAPARSTRYKWDGRGRLTEREDSISGAVSFSHDARGRLSAAAPATGRAHQRLMGPTGNIYQDASRRDRSYAPGGALLESQGARYTYGARGQLVRRRDPDEGDLTCTWNGDGTLAGLSTPDGQTVTFRYDALRRRVEKRTASEITRWSWDGDVPVHETTIAEGGTSTTSWVFEKFTPLACITSDGSAHSVVSDYLGSPHVMLDADGRISWDAELDIYGKANVRKGARDSCPWRFPGQYEDAESGLHYNRFRYYDPARGDYISQDPLRMQPDRTLYSYVQDPTAASDPLGLIDPWDVMYSQKTISDVFLDGPWKGRSLDDAIAEARKLGELPPGLELHVQDLNDQWVTLNNRTLYVAQQANLSQVNPTIVGASGDNQMNKLLDGGSPRSEQPEVVCKKG